MTKVSFLVVVLASASHFTAALSSRTFVQDPLHNPSPLRLRLRLRLRPSPSFLLKTTQAPLEEASSTTPHYPNFEPLFTGAKRDFSNRFPQYASDITDGCNAQSLATVLFLFFACLAPAIGFGSVLGAATDNTIGVLEMVASTSMSGVLYALLSAQPVQLIGPQGPVVAFIAALYPLATQVLQVDFSSLYAATGLVASGCLALLALTSASNFVQHLTRWTDEIFSVLVSTLFLAQAVGDVQKTFITTGGPPVTALLTLVTCSLTFGTALLLRSLPKTRYFTKRIRTNLANFAPAVGVLVGSLVARAARLHWGTAAVLPALQLPTQFVTSTGRSWWISLASSTSTPQLWLAAVPAGMAAAILLYLDQNITARLVNHPRFQQTKGHRTSVLDGMHGDLLVLAGITALSSCLGMPWMCGAPTRSAAHVRALSIVNDTTTTTGQQQQPVVTGTLENRVSGFSIHALIGVCALAASPRQWLAQVPQPALSGIFLYLGFTSLQGLELWERIRALWKDSNWKETVTRPVVTVFTAAQMICLAGMMKVTQSNYGVVSPLLIALLPLARWGLLKTGLVTKEDMKTLDS